MMLEVQRLESDAAPDHQWTSALDYSYRMGMQVASLLYGHQKSVVSNLNLAWVGYLKQWDNTCRVELGKVYRIGYNAYCEAHVRIMLPELGIRI